MKTIKIGGTPRRINKILDDIRQKRFNGNVKKEHMRFENKDGKCSVEIMEEAEMAYDAELDLKAEQVIENAIDEMVLEERSKR